MKIILVKNLFLINMLLFSYSFFMSSQDVDVESASCEINSEFTIKFQEYYHLETKTLDLSNFPLKDIRLAQITQEIKDLIKLTGAERLILENNKLTVIPYDLITFALTNKTLKYVSFKNNKFKIQNGSEYPEPIDKLLEKAMGKPKKDDKTRARSNTLGGIVATLWEGISPEIEKAIENSNKTSDKTQLIKKIIIIDKRIPPITIINQDKLPKNMKEKCKSVLTKMLYVGGGIIITIIPTLMTYFLENQTCDINQLNSMMLACNLNYYNGTN